MFELLSRRPTSEPRDMKPVARAEVRVADNRARRDTERTDTERFPERRRRKSGWLHAGPRAGVFGATTAALAGSAIVNTLLAERAEAQNPPLGHVVRGAGCELHVYEQGRGQPVVLIHGLGTGLGDMRASGLVSRLSSQFHVIAIDRPGYGHSDRPRDRVWGVHEQARAIREAIATLGVSRPVVLGHSFGAMVALAWALDAPETLSGLVLVSGYYYPTARADLVTMTPPVIPLLGDILRYAVLPWVNRVTVPAMYKRMFSPAPVPTRFYEEVPVSMVVRPMTIRAIGEEAALMLPGADMLARQYGQLRTPATVIAGRADAVTDPKHHSERLVDEVSGATCRLLDGVGHMAHFQATEEIAQAVAVRAGESLRRLSSDAEHVSTGAGVAAR